MGKLYGGVVVAVLINVLLWIFGSCFLEGLTSWRLFFNNTYLITEDGDRIGIYQARVALRNSNN